jgi:hypothetical protein
MPKPPADELRWLIFRLRAVPAEYLGRVSAPDEKTALNRAAHDFKITDPHRKKQLIAVNQPKDRFG